MVWEAGKYTDLYVSLVHRRLDSFLLTSALALCEYLWLVSNSLTIWSSFDITDVTSLSVMCLVFSAGCFSYSDLSGKSILDHRQGDPGLPRGRRVQSCTSEPGVFVAEPIVYTSSQHSQGMTSVLRSLAYLST